VANDCRLGAPDKLLVARNVIAMPVRMRDHELDRLQALGLDPIGDDPIDSRSDLQPSGARIDLQDPAGPEEEEDERTLEVRPDRLPNDEGIRVVLLDLHFRFGTVRRIHPRLGERRRRGPCVVHHGSRKYPDEPCKHGEVPRPGAICAHTRFETEHRLTLLP